MWHDCRSYPNKISDHETEVAMLLSSDGNHNSAVGDAKSGIPQISVVAAVRKFTVKDTEMQIYFLEFSCVCFGECVVIFRLFAFTTA
jgi:hypothetical protein